MNISILSPDKHRLETPAIILRDLWKTLELVEKYADWHQRQLDVFTSGVDYMRVQVNLNPTNGQPIDDYAISFDTAKHIALMSRTEKGNEYRTKLIEMEKSQPRIPVTGETAYWAMKIQREINEELRLPESGRLLLLSITNKKHGGLATLPAYAIDSGTSTTGSSRPTFSSTELLKQHKSSLSAMKFNTFLIGLGFLETKERPSSKKGTKEYKSVTEKGLTYGKNVTSPSNPRETQPHWFGDTFGDLLHLVETL